MMAEQNDILTFAPHAGGCCERCGQVRDELYLATLTSDREMESMALCGECAMRLRTRMERHIVQGAPQTPPQSSETAKVLKNTASNMAQKVRSNALVQAVRTDLQNSKTLQTVRDSVSDASRKVRTNLHAGTSAPAAQQPVSGVTYGAPALAAPRSKNGANRKIIAIVVLVVAAIGLVLAFGLHECEVCGDLTFGLPHKLHFMGRETWVHLCHSCYESIRDIF